MKKLKVNMLSDDYDCEECGSSYAQGTIVTLDGEPFLEMIPSAHCFGGSDYQDEDIYRAILEKLGYELEVSYE